MENKHALHSFVVRLWLERGAGSEVVWRGHIRYVQNDREAYFRDLGEMCAFLEDISGVPAPTTERAVR